MKACTFRILLRVVHAVSTIEIRCVFALTVADPPDTTRIAHRDRLLNDALDIATS